MDTCTEQTTFGEKTDVIYSCGNLHVTGPKQVISPVDYISASEHVLSREEAEDFYDKGYFLLEDGVSTDLLQEARQYVDDNWKNFTKQSKRCDDWRLHYHLELTDADGQEVEHAPILNLLLKSPKIIGRIKCMIDREISGFFYNQIAYRTPVDAKHRTEYYAPGAEYHIDGQANCSGERLPDHWTIQLGIALVDMTTKDMGNFTVFPGYHTKMKWDHYCEQKKTKTLPNLGEPDRIALKAGDVVFAHFLLPHRGGKNVVDNSSMTRDPNIKNIPLGSRELIFIRVRGKGIDYNTPERAMNVINDPWYEFEPMINNYLI